MDAYKTYIMGKDAIFFDRGLFESLKSNTSIFWKMSWRYHSIWRILHVDGLEGCDADGLQRSDIPPARTGMKYQFFQYATKEEAR